MRNSRPKADLGGLSFPSSVNFVILIHMPLKWSGSIKFHHVESILSDFDNIILSFQGTYFLSSTCVGHIFFPEGLIYILALIFLIGLEKRVSASLRKLWNKSRESRKKKIYCLESSCKRLVGIKLVSWTLCDPNRIKTVHLIYACANIMLLNAKVLCWVLNECSLVTIYESRALKVLMQSIKRKRSGSSTQSKQSKLYRTLPLK